MGLEMLAHDVARAGLGSDRIRPWANASHLVAEENLGRNAILGLELVICFLWQRAGGVHSPSRLGGIKGSRTQKLQELVP